MINRGSVTFLERLYGHRGGLIRLKSQLFWYDSRSWDKNRGRLCLLLDVSGRGTIETDAHAAGAGGGDAAALLLIDGRAQWVRVAERDVEFELG